MQATRTPLRGGVDLGTIRALVVGRALRSLGVAIALMTASLVWASPSSAAVVTTTIDGMVFTANDTNISAGATLVSYTPGSSIVDIPASVPIAGDDYAVTSIGNSAFHTKGITEVTIPNSVTAIRHLAFSGNELSTVTIPNSVTTMEAGAFRTNKLTNVVISNALTSLPDQAFDVNELTQVTLPSNLTTIGSSVFAWNSLTSVTVPATVTSIGENAFGGNHIVPGQPDSGPTLTGVTFLGAAPTTFHGITASRPSLGEGEGLTVHYPCVFHEASPAGFTAPTWNGYDSAGSSVTVTFQHSGTSPAIPSQTVDCAGTPTEPADDPTDDDRVFTGSWYSNSDGIGDPFDFTTPLTENVTLYASWEMKSVDEPDPEVIPDPGANPGPDEDGPGTTPVSQSRVLPAGGSNIGPAPILAALLTLMVGLGLVLTGRQRKA